MNAVPTIVNGLSLNKCIPFGVTREGREGPGKGLSRSSLFSSETSGLQISVYLPATYRGLGDDHNLGEL
jgi:hypothetical protein